jgi:hypothetical protein
MTILNAELHASRNAPTHFLMLTRNLYSLLYRIAHRDPPARAWPTPSSWPGAGRSKSLGRHDAVLQREVTLKTSPRQPVRPPAFRKTEYVLLCLRQQMEFRDSMVETSGTARDKSGRRRQKIRAGGRYFDRSS